MRELKEIRTDIDSVDKELKELFKKRMKLVHEVAEYKLENNSPVRHSEREAEIIREKTKDEAAFKNEIAKFFENLIEISCDYQERYLNYNPEPFEYIKINESDFKAGVKTAAHQGIKGAYSYEQAVSYFENADILSLKSFEEVFRAVSEGRADCGVLPIANITNGSVVEVFDLLSKYDLYIVNSECLEIVHCLLGKGEFSDIKAVTSHPQALAQCSEFIKEMGYSTVNSLNTAFAARDTARMSHSGVGAICSEINARLYGLKVLKRDISNRRDNRTRFIFISKKPYVFENADTVSIAFRLKNLPGTLSRVLNNFSQHGYNLTKIESRPIPGRDWEYMFYIDVDGRLEENDTAAYFSKIGFLFEEFKILGNYKSKG